MKLTMLGTGNALVTECYNTCFVIEDSYQSEKRRLKQPAVPAAQRPLANASAAAGRRKMHITNLDYAEVSYSCLFASADGKPMTFASVLQGASERHLRASTTRWRSFSSSSIRTI